jgi:LacI family transcriptional regulator
MLNYVPNLLARSFRAGDAAVGLAVPDIADPFFAAMTSSIEVDLVGRGMAVVVTSLGHSDERERSALEALLRRQISGLIVACVSADQSYMAPWQERTPIVFVDRAPTPSRPHVADSRATGPPWPRTDCTTVPAGP